MKKRLVEYLKNDAVYCKYKEDKNQEFNDFELFCIQHCQDIEDLLNENKKLYELCDALNEEHEKTFRIWQNVIEKQHKI